MIIYPPFIGDTIPAFTEDKIIIPFEQNPAVSFQEITHFGLIVKNYTDSKIIASFSTDIDNCKYNYETKQGKVVFDLPYLKALQEQAIRLDDTLTEEEKKKELAAINAFPQKKQYYKFQMSYTDDEVASIKTSFHAYSTASIGRCVGNGGEISIKGLNGNTVNLSQKIYEGNYITDVYSEPVYSYRFIFKNGTTNEVLQDSGEILHNTDTDIITQQNKRISQHNFRIKYDLLSQYYYELIYEITTINNFHISTPIYTIIKQEEPPMYFEGAIQATQDIDAKNNGYIKLTISPGLNPIKGDFIIERTSDGTEWNELTKFHLTKNSDLTLFTWKDWSIEQGIEYTYSIKQYSYNIESQRKMSNSIIAEFEDMFLSDGNRQLKIKYNPKVSSFKDTILEQKMDTIGGKYPFFFRNNQVRYKEIPISGLISYWMDDNQLFMTDEEIGLIDIEAYRKSTPSILDIFDNTKIRTTQLIDYNYAAERKFKLEVLNWLTNGEPKLFRSPAEGNYIVRLMNTSLSPNDTLGRMLHTFSSTGYEIMDNTIENLQKNKLMNLSELSDPQPQKVLKTLDYNWIGNDEIKTFTGEGIEKITWVTRQPNSEDKIIVNDETYANTTSIYTIPGGKEITLTKEILSRGDTITFYYYPELDLGTDDFGVDIFAKDIITAQDILFSAPSGYVLRDDSPAGEGILNYKEFGSDEIQTLRVFQTYILIVSKDPNYISENAQDYELKIGDTTIDCRDGQIRYFYNIPETELYDKGLGLHLDIYAKVQNSGVSSRLGQFILGQSRLAQGV